MNVAILGFSVLEQSENLPLYRYFAAQGATITAYYWGGDEVAQQMPADITKIPIASKDVIFDNLEAFDVVVRSPVIHPDQIKTTKPVTTLYNLFMEHCPAQVIGVTGTKGKGTTSTLIAKILEAAGKTVHLGGNIGTPLLDRLNIIKPDDIVVLELSNFQLIDGRFGPNIGVCLMIVPEHLDWHSDANEYYLAKANLFKYQTADDTVIYNAQNAVAINCVNNSPAVKIPFDVPADPAALPGATEGVYVAGEHIFVHGKPVAPIHDVALLGRHNLENVCAAIGATWDLIGGNLEVIHSVISSFSGLEHRLELVRDLNGVKYFNDSFATTPETSIAAIRAFQEPKIMILGGSDKGIPFDALAQEVANSDVKHVIAIGDTGQTIASLIQARLNDRNLTFSVLGTNTNMPAIVEEARKYAAPGDVVLLSTGCASFGLFTDYKDRGNQFKATVQALA